jgi:anaerobic selenocysteine-containing dehydrogenase
MKVTRRDLLGWSAAATAGLVFTPVPWKLLDDISIWTQNWRWIPQPTRGPVEVKQSFCTLCPNGCGVRVRMAAGWPVGVAGVASDSISLGALCPLGFGAHQLNWHPRRLRSVRHRATTSSWEEARAAFTKACGEGKIAIVDGQPGRSASSAMQSFVQKRDGSYGVVLGPETQALAPYEAWSGVPAAALGYDLENAQTIVSFGAPLLDGWANPGRFTRLWAERAAGMTDPQLHLIQVEASCSRTAARAWQWVSVRAGGEAALAAGLARVLLDEHLVRARVPMPPLTLADAAEQTGLSTGAILDLARTMVARPPVVAIASDGNPAIAALNVVLGAAGARGGIVRRSKHAESYASAEAVIGSARAVLIDSTVPWDFAPQTDAEVFRFAAWDGGSGKSDWLLPAPGFLEDLTDVPTAPASAIATYAVAPSLVKAPPEVQSAAQFLGSIDPASITVEKIIHQRCANLFHGRAGTLHGQEAAPVAKLASVQKLEEQLWKGAVWIGEPPRSGDFRCELKEWPATAGSARVVNWSRAWLAPVLPPLASKLYQESSLRDAPDGRNA